MNYTIFYKDDDGKKIKKYLELDYSPQIGNYISFDNKLYRIDEIEIVPYKYEICSSGKDGGLYYKTINTQYIYIYCHEQKDYKLESRKNYLNDLEKYKEKESC